MSGTYFSKIKSANVRFNRTQHIIHLHIYRMINTESYLQITNQTRLRQFKNVKMSLLFKLLVDGCYFGAFLFLFSSCNDHNKDAGPLKNYYFPLEQMEEGKVYRYTSDSDTSQGEQLWILKSFKKDGSYILKGAIYQLQDKITHQWQEGQTETGMVMLEYALAMNGIAAGSKLTSTKIIYDDIFPFNADKGGVFLFDMKWTDPADQKIGYELIRNRIFIGDTSMMVLGRQQDAMHFSIKERVEVDNDGILGLDLRGEEYYAKNIGLVKYVKDLDAKTRLVYTLDTIFDAEPYLKIIKIRSPF